MKKVSEILDKIKEDAGYYRYIRKQLTSDPNFNLLAVMANDEVYKGLSDEMKMDKSILKFMLNRPVFYLNDTLLFDEELIASDPEYSKLYTAYLNMKRNKTAYILVAGITKKRSTGVRIDIKNFYVNEDSELIQEGSQSRSLTNYSKNHSDN